ncbi:MAG: hypothetical protein HC929_25365 [Leptolyngbyaceae cyanobacterium SM2_5_2]|nr:hypothetical protein [Leptolyngbyaceae cyanobacterium SM2_5_2]
MMIETATADNVDSTIKDGPEVLTPAPELAQRFCHWFKFGYEHIYRTGEGWRTETRYPLSPRNLWLKYCNPNQTIGIRFDSQTRYGLLDLDTASAYHPYQDPTAITRIKAALESIGIVRTLLTRSSDSEGLHLYYFLPEPVSTFGLACAVAEALADADLEIAPGQLESFPNIKRYDRQNPTAYNGHRLPLQPGSFACLVENDGQPILGGLETFLAVAEQQSDRQDMALLKRKMKTARQRVTKRRYKTSPVGKLAQWQKDLTERIKQGFNKNGQTNQIIGAVAEYGRVFEAIDSLDKLTQYIIETVKNLPGFKRFCGHIKDLATRAQHWARTAIAKRYIPGTTPRTGGDYWREGRQPNSANHNRQSEARERIEGAVASLSERDQLPTGATDRAKAIRAEAIALYGAGPSMATLFKPDSLPYWHPEHYGQRCVIAQPESNTADSDPIPTDSDKSPEPSQGEELQAKAPNEGCDLSCSRPSPPRLGKAESQTLTARARRTIDRPGESRLPPERSPPAHDAPGACQ